MISTISQSPAFNANFFVNRSDIKQLRLMKGVRSIMPEKPKSPNCERLEIKCDDKFNDKNIDLLDNLGINYGVHFPSAKNKK